MRIYILIGSIFILLGVIGTIFSTINMMDDVVWLTAWCPSIITVVEGILIIDENVGKE